MKLPANCNETRKTLMLPKCTVLTMENSLSDRAVRHDTQNIFLYHKYFKELIFSIIKCYQEDSQLPAITRKLDLRF